MQLVRLMRDGEVVRMSKRTGKAIQLADLLDEVPVDAPPGSSLTCVKQMRRWILTWILPCSRMRRIRSTMSSMQTPEFAAFCVRLKRTGFPSWDCTDAELAKLDSSEETELIRHIASYTDEIVAAAKDYDPARITRYVITLATLFHKFYNAKRVKGEEDGLLHARLLLCVATRTVIENVLKMFNISAPETM